jgi:hypothetical protein
MVILEELTDRVIAHGITVEFKAHCGDGGKLVIVPSRFLRVLT